MMSQKTNDPWRPGSHERKTVEKPPGKTGNQEPPHRTLTPTRKVPFLAFPLWRDGIGGILEALGYRFDPWPGTVDKDPVLPQLRLRL